MGQVEFKDTVGKLGLQVSASYDLDELETRDVVEEHYSQMYTRLFRHKWVKLTRNVEVLKQGNPTSETRGTYVGKIFGQHRDFFGDPSSPGFLHVQVQSKNGTVSY